MTEDEKLVEIGKILADWNPLGDGAADANDLNGFKSEAEDILWVMDLYGYSVMTAVSQVLREAFMIDLDKRELERHSKKIQDILGK